MVSESDSISYIKVPSEIEALLLEADLVWKNQPKYNSALKDDKHPLYIMITKEEYPRVITVRRVDLDIPHTSVFGPFPATHNMRTVLGLLRPIFPYSNHVVGKKPCIYSQMGLCNPCPNYINALNNPFLKKVLYKRYSQNIKNIRGVLSGRIRKVREELEKEMKELSKKEEFEEATRARNQIFRLDYITTPITEVGRFVENPNLIEDIRNEEADHLLRLLSGYFKIKVLKRIECFDVAHLAGSSTTASQVTFEGGAPVKSLYRHYRIRQNKGNDDISSLSEVAHRREKRLADWGVPDLIIVDGGKGQTKVFNDVFSKHNIPVIGLAKRFETIVIPRDEGGYSLIKPKGKALALLVRLRNEAHRFARTYHHKLLKKYLLEN
jgi:excinuclease ABC subunit C